MIRQDKSFDDKVKTFKNNIYGTTKGQIREAVLIRDLTELLATRKNLTILDVGGGQGQISLQLAQMGHKVTLTDISNEMLDVARETAKSLQLENVKFIHSPLQELAGLLDGKFDLVLCHAVFEWLEEPQAAMSTLNHFCHNQGAISLMFYNAVGQSLSNLIYGNFDYIRAGMQAKKVVKLNPQSALRLEQVTSWCHALNLQIQSKTGVRCFHDYMRHTEHWQSQFDDILDMELLYSKQEPYASIGRYTHLILKPGEK